MDFQSVALEILTQSHDQVTIHYNCMLQSYTSLCVLVILSMGFFFFQLYVIQMPYFLSLNSFPIFVCLCAVICFKSRQNIVCVCMCVCMCVCIHIHTYIYIYVVGVMKMGNTSPRAGSNPHLQPGNRHQQDIARTECQNNVTAWDIRSWCRQPDFPLGQHYKVNMSAHCHNSVSLLTCHYML